MCNKSELQSIEKRYNRLINEKSPYLLQHANNPVDWYPWTKEAFDRAIEENKPIFLSIGYSTCHWCHIMAHESFEDTEVAKLMNDVFISIKVDKEERPDINNIYMTVCQILTGKSGWPLTIIMTPDKKPFFAGTYIPKENRFGQIGMLYLIPRIREIWTIRRIEVLSSAEQITVSLQELSNDFPYEEPDESILDLAYEKIAYFFDPKNGGFGTGPKFPTPHNLFFLLRYWKRRGDKKVLEMVEKTLQSMQLGGIYDHIGFGFHRYSTDSIWRVPHFEKMLYDQALIGMAYTEAYQATGHKLYKKCAKEIFTYVLRDMTSPTGGFYSAEDADSEGEEGRFYLWSHDEIKSTLKKEEAELIIDIFNIEKQGNFTQEATGKKSGLNILYLKKNIKQIADSLKIPEEELEKRVEKIRQKLFDFRKKRIPPYKDDKILADWNGLMIAALAKGARIFDESVFLDAAESAVHFVLKNMMDSEGRLLHRYRDGQAAIKSFLDDYEFLIWGLIELYETTFDAYYLQTALKINEDTLKYFWDNKKGGFYFNANDGETILIRKKEIYDGAIPSGNSVAMLNLLRLGRMSARPEFEKKAAQIGCIFSNSVIRAPLSYTQFLVALNFGIGPSYEVVIVGDRKAEDTKTLLKALRKHFIPNKVVLLRSTEQQYPEASKLEGFAQDLPVVNTKPTVYVCINNTCRPPVTDIDKVLELLGEG